MSLGCTRCRVRPGGRMSYYTRDARRTLNGPNGLVMPRRRGRGLRGLGDSSAGVPAGTRLLYNVTFTVPTLSVDNSKQIAALVGTALSTKWGIQVISESDTVGFLYNATPGFTLTVLTQVDYGAANDVKSIIDGEVYNAGRQITSSSIAIIQPQAGTTTTTQQPQPPFDLGAWLSTNWIWLALGLGAVVAAEELL